MRRHSFDPISFVFGMVFALMGIAFATGNIDLGDLRASWVWPLPLIALGLLMLFSARRRSEEGEGRPADEAEREGEEEPAPEDAERTEPVEP